MKRNIILAASIAAVLVVVAVIAFLQSGKKPPPDPAPAVDKPVVTPPLPAPVPVPSVVPDTPGPPPPVAPIDRAPAPSLLAGRVVSAEDLQPITGARVRIAVDLPGGTVARDAWLAEASSGPRGEFVFERLESVPYRLQASASGRADAVARGVVAGADGVELRLASSAPIPCRLVLSLDEGDQPLGSQKVSFALPDDGWSFDAVTDPAGLFLLSGLSEIDLEAKKRFLEIIVDGYADPLLWPAKDDPDVRFTVRVDKGATVIGRVTDRATGAPLAGALVVSEYGHRVTTDAAGNYTIGGIDFGLMYYARGYSVVSADIDEYTDDLEYLRPVRIDIALDRGMTISGRVTDKAGRPVAGARVGVARDVLDLDYDEDRMEAFLLGQLAARTDAAGQYRIDGLPALALDLPNIVEFEVRPDGAAGGVLFDIDIPIDSGSMQHDFVLDVAEEVVGVVLQANGQPLAGARVVAQSLGDDNFAVASTLDDGSFGLRSLVAGEYGVIVERDGRPLHYSTFSAPPASPIELRLAPPRGVRGTVVALADGRPLASAPVRLVLLKGGAQIALETTTAADGTFALDGAPAGSFILEIRRPPPHLPFSALSVMEKISVDLTQSDWEGRIDYPGYPSGEVVIHFHQASGKADNVRVEVVYFASGRLKVGRPAGTGRGYAIGEASDRLSIRLREGEYTFRCILDPEGRKLVQTTTATVADQQIIEREVSFPAP